MSDTVIPFALAMARCMDHMTEAIRADLDDDGLLASDRRLDADALAREWGFTPDLRATIAEMAQEFALDEISGE
jgi:hypothetical protein